MPIYRLIDVGGYKVFMTHGHAYSVKSGYDEICREASRLGADIVLFGHTHVPTLEYIEKGSIRGVDRRLAIFNPGSLGGLFDGSFGNLSVGEGGFLLSHGKYHNIIGR
jgi:predicted phosphodiesterase